MKQIKRIYYPIMALVFVLFLIFGFTNVSVASTSTAVDDAFMLRVMEHAETISTDYSDRNSISNNSSTLKSAYTYIQNALDDSIENAGLTETNASGYDTASAATVPTLIKHQSTATSDTLNEINYDYDTNIYVDRQVNNLVVYIPGTDTINGSITAEAIMLTTRYDSIGDEATSAGVIGSMIETINSIVTSGSTYKNDLLFVFADGGLENSIGLYTFVNQFIGFTNVYSRVGLVCDFDTMGNNGPLVMYSSTGENSKLIQEFSNFNTYAEVSSFLTATQNDEFDTDKAYQDKLSLNFANIGGLENEQSAGDNFANINETVISAHANMMNDIVSNFGTMTLSDLESDTTADVYFSFLSLFTISYDAMIAIILACAVVALLALVIIFNANKKTFNMTKTFLGALVGLIAIFGAIISLYVVYFCVVLILGAFWIVDINAILLLSYANVGIVIAACVIACTALVAMYIILKKAFLVQGVDLVRGNVFLIALAAIVTGFFIPALSYVFTFIAIVQLLMMIITIFAKDGFKNKFGYDIERLFLYVWPVIICLPLVISCIYLNVITKLTIMLPLIAILLLPLVGTILPYADYLKPSLNKAIKVLPPLTLRYQKEVTEMVEDKAKRGRWSEQTYVKEYKEKTPWTYHNWMGIVAVGVIASLIMIICGTGASGFAKSVISPSPTMENYFYNNAINYVYEDDNGVTSKTLQIADLQLYNYAAQVIDDMKWNSDKGVYEKSNTSFNMVSGYVYTATNSFYVIPADINTTNRLSVSFDGVSNITSITFKSTSDADDDDSFIFYNDQHLDELTFVIPDSYSTLFAIEFEADKTVDDIEITYEEAYEGKENLKSISDISSLIDEYEDDEIGDYINYNIIYRKTFTMSYTPD